jgi:S-disulfanyl-L-cysteine oxidoreductase SoxD
MSQMRYLAATAILFLAAIGAGVQAQSTKSVADGVYTDVQARRGAAAYDSACGRCHRGDLGGGDGPALKDDRFNRTFAGQDLKHLYTRIATTMPRGAPGSMADSVYLDILAYIVRENGFPAGPQDLSLDHLAGVEVQPTRAKPLPPVGDFSYVEVAGCLSAAGDGIWMLTNASDPVAVAAPQYASGQENVVSGFSRTDNPDAVSGFSTAVALGEAVSRTPGTRSFRLLDAMAYGPERFVGHTMHVRGLLIRLPAEHRMTVSEMRSLATTCGK